MLLTFGSSAMGTVLPWGRGEERKNKLIFIGRNLDREQLKADFEACINPAPLTARTAPAGA